MLRKFSIITHAVMLVLIIWTPAALAFDTDEAILVQEIAELEGQVQSLQTQLTTIQVNNERQRLEIVKMQEELYKCLQGETVSRSQNGGK